MFNVTRIMPAPISLAHRRSYSEKDVLDALNEMFMGKCYICETKELISINVEHFDAHEGNEDKKYDWNNLFFCCARCNNMKRHLFNGLLDCTDANIDVLRLIKHQFPVTPHQKEIVIQAMNSDPKTIKTAELIRKVFNDTDTANREISLVAIRNKIFKRYGLFFKYLNTYLDHDQLDKDRENAFEHLKKMMRKDQEYSAFIRWAVLDDPNLSPQLEAYID